MTDFTMNHNFVEIMSGTNSVVNPAYMEAVKDVENGGNKAMSTLKDFLVSIEKVADSSKDPKVSASKGNIKQFSGYENIQTVMNFLSKNLSGVHLVSDLRTIYDCLEKYQPQFTDGYTKNCRLIVLEYESAVYLLVTGLSMLMANNMEVVQNGEQIKIQKKSTDTMGMIGKTVTDLAKQMNAKDHKEYLEAMIKSCDKKPVDTKLEAVSMTFTESNVMDIMKLIDAMFTNVKKIGTYTKSMINTIKSSVFGIVPLIRTCMYLRYKKKADTVLALEQQAAFIHQNIEILQNKTGMDPNKKALVIKKQKAQAEAYQKKADKLRAQLIETERSVSEEISSKPEKTTSDDDFVLEMAGR